MNQLDSFGKGKDPFGYNFNMTFSVQKAITHLENRNFICDILVPEMFQLWRNQPLLVTIVKLENKIRKSINLTTKLRPYVCIIACAV